MSPRKGGRLALNLTGGEHKFAASVPGTSIGSAGEFTLTGTAIVAKAARIEQTGPSLDQNGLVLAKPKDKVVVFDFDPFATVVEETPVSDTWQPLEASPGMGSLVWVNYWGNDALTVDLNGVLYNVPPMMNDIPGRLQLQLMPGVYRYTASIPNGSLNGEVVVQVGQVNGLSISADPLPQPEFEIGEKSPLPLPVTLRVFQETLTPNISMTPIGEVATADEPPLYLPNTGGVLEAQVPNAEPVITEAGVLVKNYAGSSLIFTIDHQMFVIENNSEQTLPLSPGHYSYTASLPFVATTGIVDLRAGSTVELSIVLNVERDFLTIYQN